MSTDYPWAPLETQLDDTVTGHWPHGALVIDAWHLIGVPHMWDSFSVAFPLRWKGNRKTRVGYQWQPVWIEVVFTCLIPISWEVIWGAGCGRQRKMEVAVAAPGTGKRCWPRSREVMTSERAMSWVLSTLGDAFLLCRATGNTVLVCVWAVLLWLLLHESTGGFFLVRWQRVSWASLWFAGMEWTAESVSRIKCSSRAECQEEAERE